MQNSLKGFIVGALALAGVGLASFDAEAMPIQPLSPTATATASVEQVYYYGYRRPFRFRRFGYGYGFRRPFYGYGYGFRRPFYGYRRPFYGYGYRRF